MIPEMPPQRSAKPGFAPSSIIERAAQHLDWTIAFGMRHNTQRGLEETTNQQPRPDPPRIPRASGLRSSRAGGHRLLLTSRLCLASVVVAAAAAGLGIFLFTHYAGEKATAKSALATEAPAKASEATPLIRGLAMMPPAASTTQTATLAGRAPTLAAWEWEAKLTFGPPLSPPGWPKSEVAATPVKMLEVTSTVASPAPRNQPTVPSSEKSIEDAIQNAVGRASRTLRQVGWFEVVETRGHIQDGKVAHYQVALKVGFTLGDDD
jgi:flavin-binding protein dodecin